VSLPTPYYQDSAVTIYHSDCLELMREMEPGSVDMVLTDPPFGHNNNNGDLIHHREAALGQRLSPNDESGRPIANDGPEANEIYRASLKEWHTLMKPGCCCCCCCGGGGPDPQFARWSLWMDEVFDFKQMVVWDKGPMGMGWHYRRSYETVLVGQKQGAACRWFDDTNQIENIIRNIHKIIPSAKEHPTPKPISLMQWFIHLHSEKGDLILDPFMGSGTTLRAAKDLNRRAIGIEIEEKYCEIAAKRMAQEALAL
jgi:site-specific DNA-methyltransferase (adenine-specific)